MKKILSLVLLLSVLVGCAAALSSCGKEPVCDHPNMTYEKTSAKNHKGTCPDCGYTTTTAHQFSDNVCTLCGYKREATAADPWQDEFDGKSYPWDTANLVMSVSDNSNQGELEASGKAFVSGEWTQSNINPGNTIASVDDGILRQVITRNATAASVTHVAMSYVYVSDVGWGEVLDRIATETAADNTPDIYYNLLYDMVGASIRGYFKNIYDNEYLGCFYDTYNPEEDTRGYYWEYMQDLTFSTKIMYLIASDYSFDLPRSYLVMPVSLTLLNTVTDVTGDYDNNGIVNLNDFYAMINNGEWTWTKIIEYTNAVKKQDRNGGYSLSGDSVAGIAMSFQSGLATSAAMYSSSMKIVNRTVGDNGEYVYSYPETCPQSLVDVCNMLFNQIAGTDGERDQTYVASGTSGVILYKGHTQQAEDMFTQNRLLINPSAVLGAIEKKAYQNMWDEDTGSLGFAVAPVAKLTAEGEYQTAIHNCGKVFALSSKCSNVDAACAFINYNSVNSTDILKEYYEWALGYNKAVTTKNVELLLNMKENVVSSHDKVVEDALGILYNLEEVPDPFGSGGTMLFGNTRWHTFALSYWRCNQITQLYSAIKDYKQSKIEEIQRDFINNAR